MSQKIRIGNDIDIHWSLKDESSAPYNVEGRTFAIELNVGTKRVRIKDATAEGNVIHFVYYGMDQKYTGSYALKYIENEKEVNMVTFDTKDAFTLVDHSWQAIDEGETPETIQLEFVTIVSSILERVGPKGDTGVGIESVEQTQTSHEDEGVNIVKVTLTDGTESEFEVRNGSKGSKGDKGDEPNITADNEGTLYVDGEVLTEIVKETVEAVNAGESARVIAEEARAMAERNRVFEEQSREFGERQRVTAEDNRDTSEQGRVSAESQRDSAEAQRAEAEGDRVSAEADRVAGESERIDNETARAAAEQSRETAETSRAGAESARVSAESARVTAEQGRVTAETARETQAGADHTQAGLDHSAAVSDHAVAALDHTQAGLDHTQAGLDHTQAGLDHTAVLEAIDDAEEAAETANTAAENADAAREAIQDDLAKKADKEGYFRSLVSGAAESLMGKTIETFEFSFLRYTGASGIAKIAEVRGRSQVWNQLMNFTDASSLSDKGISVDISNNKIHAYGTKNSDASLYIALPTVVSVNYISGHKYYINCPVQSDCKFITQIVGTNSNPYFYGPTIFTANSAGSGNVNLRGGGNIGVVIDWTGYINIIDLTLEFGPGNEPATVEEYVARYGSGPFPFDPGSILSNKTQALEVRDADDNLRGTIALNLTTLTGKLNGEGESVTIFPDGSRSAGSVYDSLIVDEDGWARRASVAMGVRVYQAGDENDPAVVTDKAATVYALATPLEYVLDTPIYLGFQVFAGGTITQTPQAPDSAPMVMDVIYPLDLEKDYVPSDSVDALLVALGNAYGGTWTRTYNPTTGKHEFTYTA